MRGYVVVTSDKRTVGRVVDVQEGYLIVRSGRLRRTRRAIPREFAHATDSSRTVHVTVPRRVLRDAPRADRRNRFDRHESARHFGLAESYLESAQREAQADVIVALQATQGLTPLARETLSL